MEVLIVLMKMIKKVATYMCLNQKVKTQKLVQ